MNWAMSLTPEQQCRGRQVYKQVQDVVKPSFQRQQQRCQLVPWDTFQFEPAAVRSVRRSVNFCVFPRKRSLTPAQPLEAFPWHPRSE